MQVTAHSAVPNSANTLNFSLLENEGKSDILLFRFHDPNFKPEVKNDSVADAASGSATGQEDKAGNQPP